jgi:D-alanine--poly(phosphoribitol) ligase subunit 2
MNEIDLDEARIIDAVYHALDDANEDLPASKRLRKSADQVLFGNGAVIDSIELVSLIVHVEGRLAEELGMQVTLADERAMSQKHSPFRTVGTLCDYIRTLAGDDAR